METTIGVGNIDTLSCDNICSETTSDDVAITGSVFPDNDVVESAHVMTHVPDAHSSGTPEANTTHDTLCSGNINTKTTTGNSDLSDAECLDDSDVECTPDVVTFPDTVSSADIGADTPANVDAPQTADADETVLHIDIAVPDHLDDIVQQGPYLLNLLFRVHILLWRQLLVLLILIHYHVTIFVLRPQLMI